MSTRLAGLIVLCAFLTTGVAVQAHHAVAGIYDLNKEVVLEGKLKKLNFRQSAREHRARRSRIRR